MHLTSIVGKIVERAISSIITPRLFLSGAFGQNQFAYLERRSCRDLLGLLTLQWIRSISEKKVVGAFFSDISGAFDRVSSQRLLQKLEIAGVSGDLLAFFISYLSPRSSQVVVNGKHSQSRNLQNTIFQGSVLGPLLWNLFFSDVSVAVRAVQAEEKIFADDLNAFRDFPLETRDFQIDENMLACQHSVHEWGKSSRVVFDPSKEHFATIHHQRARGDNFRLLGILFDPKLQMSNAIDRIYQKSSQKLKSLLRILNFYSLLDLVVSYKSHVLSQSEIGISAIYHASNSCLAKLDLVQRRFLRHINISTECAFLDFNIAPLGLRRDIAMPGLVFRFFFYMRLFSVLNSARCYEVNAKNEYSKK